MSLLVKLLNEELAAVKAERDTLAGTLREAQSALLLCEDALLDDALDWHEAHVGRDEMDAEDCAVCVVTNALDKADRALAVPSVEQTGEAADHAPDCESNVGFYAPGIPAPCTCGLAVTPERDASGGGRWRG